eukprot:353578-Chlamydomonas_euryale.AAC.7
MRPRPRIQPTRPYARTSGGVAAPPRTEQAAAAPHNAPRAVRSAGLATGLTGEAWFHTARPVASLKGKLQPPRVRLGAPSFSEGRGQRIGSTNSMTRHPRGCHSRLLQGAVGGCKMGAHSRCLPVLGSTAPFPERSADEVSPRCHQKTCETTNVG